MKRLILFIAILSATSPTWSAVAYVSDADKLNVVSGNDAFTSFAVSGTNPTIIIVAAINSITASVSSVVLSAGLTGGTPYLVKQQHSVAGATTMEIWAIPAPAGTGTITVSYSSSLNHQCNAILMQGADQTTPAIIAEAAATTGSVSPLSVTPSNLTANDAVVYGGAIDGGDGPIAISGTETFNGNSTNVNMAAGYRLGTGSVSVTFNVTTTSEVMIGVRVQTPTGGATVTCPSVIGSGVLCGNGV